MNHKGPYKGPFNKHKGHFILYKLSNKRYLIKKKKMLKKY